MTVLTSVSYTTRNRDLERNASFVTVTSAYPNWLRRRGSLLLQSWCWFIPGSRSTHCEASLACSFPRAALRRSQSCAGKMEPIGSISLRGQTGGVEEFLPSFRFRMCHICGTMTGCSIRCYATGCRFHLHPMCGKKAGNVYMEIETPEARADRRDQGVHLVAKCPR